MSDTPFIQFLSTVSEENQLAAEQLHTVFIDSGCRCDIKDSKSGYLVSYINKDKKTAANFVCRKTGTLIRLYPQHLNQYESFLDTLPEGMKKEIKKAAVCKRLINPDDCNPRCMKGYEFSMDQEPYQKCRYMAFQFKLCKESNPAILAFVENELK